MEWLALGRSKIPLTYKAADYIQNKVIGDIQEQLFYNDVRHQSVYYIVLRCSCIVQRYATQSITFTAHFCMIDMVTSQLCICSKQWHISPDKQTNHPSTRTHLADKNVYKTQYKGNNDTGNSHNLLCSPIFKAANASSRSSVATPVAVAVNTYYTYT